MATRQVRRIVTRYSLWAAIAVLVILVGLLGRGTWGVYSKMQEAAVLRANAVAERDALLSRQSELEETIRELDTPRGVEEEIRTRYSVVKPGETEYVLVDEAGATSTGSKTSPGLWYDIKSWLGI